MTRVRTDRPDVLEASLIGPARTHYSAGQVEAICVAVSCRCGRPGYYITAAQELRARRCSDDTCHARPASRRFGVVVQLARVGAEERRPGRGRSLGAFEEARNGYGITTPSENVGLAGSESKIEICSSKEVTAIEPEIAPGVPNPKFAHTVRQMRLRTSGSKGTLEL